MTDKPTPTEAELNTILCAHWPAFAMQSTLVKIWVRDALQDAIDKWGQPAQARAVAVPLTNAQIRSMLNKHPPEDVCDWSYRMGIDDAELHHGIKGGGEC